MPTITPSDPPEHLRYRKLIFRSFSKNFVEALEPAISDIVNGLIDRFIYHGEVDFEHEFAALVPGYVITDALGVPREDQGLFMRWTDEITATIMFFEALSREQELRYKRSFVEFQHYFAGKIEEKRANPQNDMISLLVTARVEGERPLDVPEILDIIRIIMLGGNETTASWIAGTMLILLDHPDVMQRVRDDRSLIPQMLEETLRLLSPSRWNRRTMEGSSCTVSGVEIPEGATVKPGMEFWELRRKILPGAVQVRHGPHGADALVLRPRCPLLRRQGPGAGRSQARVPDAVRPPGRHPACRTA